MTATAQRSRCFTRPPARGRRCWSASPATKRWTLPAATQSCRWSAEPSSPLPRRPSTWWRATSATLYCRGHFCVDRRSRCRGRRARQLQPHPGADCQGAVERRPGHGGGGGWVSHVDGAVRRPGACCIRRCRCQQGRRCCCRRGGCQPDRPARWECPRAHGQHPLGRRERPPQLRGGRLLAALRHQTERPVPVAGIRLGSVCAAGV